MRSAFFSLCLLLACTVAYGEDPWSSLFNYAEPASVEGKTFPGGGRYLMPKILSGRPIKIYVTGYQVKPEKFPHIQEQIAESYND